MWFGFVLRAEDGGLVTTKNGRLEGPADSLTAKALGMGVEKPWFGFKGMVSGMS